MTFAADATGVESSQRRGLIQITHGVTNYFLATGDRDIVYNGNTFAAVPAQRSAIPISSLTQTVDTTIIMAASHPLAQRYMAAGGSPPQQIIVTLREMEMTSGEVQQVWVGYVTSASYQGSTVSFRVPARSQESLKRPLPTVLVDTSCSNVLYDPWCTAARAGSLVVTTTATTADGRAVSVNDIGGNPDEWFQFGELLHVASGERMTIADQVGKQLTLLGPIAELHSADAVQIFAGCDHSIATCQTKFANRQNYAGLPQRPSYNIFLPTGVGAET